MSYTLGTSLKHLSVFGSIANVHVPDEKRKKLDAKSEKCILVGYLHEQKGISAITPNQTGVTKPGCCVRFLVLLTLDSIPVTSRTPFYTLQMYNA